MFFVKYIREAIRRKIFSQKKYAPLFDQKQVNKYKLKKIKKIEKNCSKKNILWNNLKEGKTRKRKSVKKTIVSNKTNCVCSFLDNYTP